LFNRLKFDPVLLLPAAAATVTPAAAVSSATVTEGVTPVMPEVKPSSQTVFTLRNDSPMALPFQMKQAAVTKTFEEQALQGVFVFEPSTAVVEVGASLSVQAQFVPGTARDTPYQQVNNKHVFPQCVLMIVIADCTQSVKLLGPLVIVKAINHTAFQMLSCYCCEYTFSTAVHTIAGCCVRVWPNKRIML
jgi:hypothetical protein